MIPSLLTAPLFECFITGHLKTRLTDYTKVASGLFITISNQDYSVSIHDRNIQTFSIDLHKILDGSAPEIIKELFKLREDSVYNLRHTSQFTIPCLNTWYHGIESVSFLVSET